VCERIEKVFFKFLREKLFLFRHLNDAKYLCVILYGDCVCLSFLYFFFVYAAIEFFFDE